MNKKKIETEIFACYQRFHTRYATRFGAIRVNPIKLSDIAILLEYKHQQETFDFSERQDQFTWLLEIVAHIGRFRLIESFEESLNDQVNRSFLMSVLLSQNLFSSVKSSLRDSNPNFAEKLLDILREAEKNRYADVQLLEQRLAPHL